MATTDVEITISAARDLKNVNWKHGDLCPYAVAWIDDGRQPNKVTTRVDPSGDTNPSWGQKFTLSVTKERLEDARLICEIYHDKAEDPAKGIVGRASLSLLEVVDAGGYDEPQDRTLKLKRPSGRPHGKLDVIVRLRERRGVYGAPPQPGAYGQSYHPEGGQTNRDWQSNYSSPYPAQPYAQNYPSQPYPNYSYSGYPPYGATPPQPSYGAPPPQPYGSYGGNPSYGAPPSQSYGAPPPDYYNQPQNPNAAPKKSSKFGGIGTGLAVGALAGAVGGLALGEYVDHKEDEAAEEQAEEDADRYAELEAARDDNYGGGDDYGYGDDY